MGKILSLKSIDNNIHYDDQALNFSVKNVVDLSPFLSRLKDLKDEIVISKKDVDATTFNNLIAIYKKNNNQFNDKGLWMSYICTDFIQYSFIFEKKTYTYNTPTTFYLTRVSLIDSVFHFSIEPKPIINEKLINLINIFNHNEKLSVKNFKDGDYLKQFLDKFKFLKPTTIKAKYYGCYDPYENRLKKEIKEIAELNIDLYKSNIVYTKDEYINQEFKEPPLLVINNPLNFYQKISIRSALTENTIIYGPPGTGKSEIIVNIIANAIVNEKKLLITCEKKTALDVLLERLKKLKGLCLFLNAIHDEDLVYQKVNEIQQRLGNFWEMSVDNKSINEPFNKQVYDLLSIQKFTRRWLGFYQKINDWIKIDDMPKTFLDYDSFERETKELNDLKKSIKDFDLLMQFKEKNLKPSESIWSLIRRIFYYNEFKNKFILNDNEADYFFGLLDEFNKQKAKSLFYDREEFHKNFEQRYIEFYKIMEAINIKKDQSFYDVIKKDTTIFEQQMIVFSKIFESCPEAMKSQSFRRFLINKRKNHRQFVNSISKTPEYYKFNAIYNYLTNGKIKKRSFRLKKFTDSECSLLKQKYEAIALFSSLSLPLNCSYLLTNDFDPNKLWINLTCDLVYFYLNDEVKTEEMKFLIKNKAIKVDKKLTDIVERSNLSKVIDKINNVVQFEEVNLNKTLIGDKSINQSVIEFIKENSQTIETISEDIYERYIIWLRNELINTDADFKKKANEMFQVAKIPSNKMKISNFIKRYEQILRKIFPVWIGSPNDVSNFVEFKEKIFDITIVDEASQMLMENAVPALYRSKHYIVAGDDKQLKATVAFGKKFKFDGKIDFMDEIDFDIVESLLDRASVALWNSFILKNHYRSKKQELIAFSNEYIYNNELIFASVNDTEYKAIEVINVENAYYINSVNEKEAMQVVQKLSEIIDDYESFLIITFSLPQAEYIEKLLLQCEKANKINDMLSNGSLKIRNLENVQGFEADCVLLSISYAPKDENSNLKILGPIIQDGGSNRLNVAITRSKYKMIMIKSIYASEMNVNRDNKDALVFYNFISYLDGLENYYNALTNVTQVETAKYKYGNQIIEFLKPFLKKYKLDYTCNFWLGNFFADIVVYEKNLNHIRLVICLDYWSKYNQTKDFITSINTQEYLMNIGYKFVRIKELEWQFAKEMISTNIKQIMGWK